MYNDPTFEKKECGLLFQQSLLMHIIILIDSSNLPVLAALPLMFVHAH